MLSISRWFAAARRLADALRRTPAGPSGTRSTRVARKANGTQARSTWTCCAAIFKPASAASPTRRRPRDHPSRSGSTPTSCPPRLRGTTGHPTPTPARVCLRRLRRGVGHRRLLRPGNRGRGEGVPATHPRPQGGRHCRPCHRCRLAVAGDAPDVGLSPTGGCPEPAQFASRCASSCRSAADTSAPGSS